MNVAGIDFDNLKAFYNIDITGVTPTHSFYGVAILANCKLFPLAYGVSVFLHLINLGQMSLPYTKFEYSTMYVYEVYR